MAEAELNEAADVGQETRPALTNEMADKLSRQLMGRQAALSIRVAAVFMVIVLGVPLFNYFAPEIAATPVAGFTLTWLILGLLFFPITWGLSFYFVNKSDKIEAECAELLRHENTITAEVNSHGAV